MTSVNRQYILYGAFALPLSWLTISLFIFLPKYYIDSGLVTLSGLGIIAVLFRVTDALLDILIGRYLEGKKSESHSLLKRIRITVMALSLAIFLVFYPAATSGFIFPQSLILGMAVLMLIATLTVVQISYDAVIPNLVSGYRERSTLISYRSAAILAGSLLASAVPTILYTGYSLSVSWLITGIILIILFNVSAALNEKFLRYKGEVRERVPIKRILLRASELIKEAPVRNLLIAFIFTSIGAALPAALILFYVENVIQSDNGPLFVALYILTAVISLPFWNWVGGKVEKNTAWMIGLLINAGMLFYIYTLGSGDEFRYGTAVIISAAGYGATLLFPTSMQADIVDYDQWRFGERRQAEIASVCLFTKKTFAALSLGVAFFVLGVSEGGAGQVDLDQEGVISMLKLFYALIPGLVSVAAIFWIIRYDLTDARLGGIQNDLLK